MIFLSFFASYCVYAEKSNHKESTMSFVFATWNLGHFSEGQKPYSLIKGDGLYEKAKEFESVIKDSLSADVLCLNEYSTVFGEDTEGKEYLSRNLALKNYNVQFEGPLIGFSCNAIFGNLEIKNIKVNLFDCIKPFVKEVPRAKNYYYITGDLYIQGRIIKLVCAHIISSNGPLCCAMNVEIINKLNEFDKVILCGDWNSLDYSVFKQAGYELGNTGNIKTYPKKSYPLDNIIVKGVKISETRMIRSNLSDHCPLVCKITVDSY